jgi:hypothetical protein
MVCTSRRRGRGGPGAVVRLHPLYPPGKRHHVTQKRTGRYRLHPTIASGRLGVSPHHQQGSLAKACRAGKQREAPRAAQAHPQLLGQAWARDDIWPGLGDIQLGGENGKGTSYTSTTMSHVPSCLPTVRTLQYPRKSLVGYGNSDPPCHKYPHALNRFGRRWVVDRCATQRFIDFYLISDVDHGKRL